MKRTLIVMLALILIPLFMGLLCPCAKAAPEDQPVFQRVACHGCCPEMDASPECASILSPTQMPSFLNESSFRTVNVLKALSPGENRGIAINRRAFVPAGDEPSPGFSHLPLYLTLQVFRI